jgi:hypothetical protein
MSRQSNSSAKKIEPHFAKSKNEDALALMHLTPRLKRYVVYECPVKLACLPLLESINKLRAEGINDAVIDNAMLEGIKKQIKEDTLAVWGVKHPDA